MRRWEAYIHDSALDALVQLSIVHAEFESQHPFLDGNGRIGRMLIPLFLFEKKLLRKPTFYISAYLEANRDEYYDRLLAVSRDDDWTGWCEFFLRAIQRQAIQNAAKAREILTLYESRKEWIVEQTHSQHAIRALDFVFSDPVFIASEFINEANIPNATARRILNILADKGLLSLLREGSGRRPAIYAFTELINIAEGREVL
jgi:Fic family protein